MKILLTCYSFINQDFSKNGEDVLTYLHGLPDQSWPEPDEEDPLSVIDQVKLAMLSGKNTFEFLGRTSDGIWLQGEL